MEALAAAIAARGERAGRRFVEFFTATIRNRNTRTAYARVVKQFFDWCEDHRLGLDHIEPITVGAYVEQLGAEAAKPTVKQHLAAIRQLFDYLVTGGTKRAGMMPDSARRALWGWTSIAPHSGAMHL